MASIENKLNMSSLENEILLNPRWPKEDYKNLFSLARKAQEERQLKAHVWVATSGSTATSISGIKLVALSKQALLNSATAVNLHLQSDSTDVWTQVLPPFHVGGMGVEVRASLVGAKVVPALKEHKWDANYFYKILQSEKCTLSALVPTQVYDLVVQNYKSPSHLRAIVVGGGALDEDLYKKARALGWPLLPSYGMTETASQIATATLQSLEQKEFPEIGLLSHAEVRKNSDGFLQVKATSLLTCYAQNIGSEAKSWDPKVNGWFTTEDRGEVVNEVLQIQGRSQDYVKIGGEGTNVTRLRSLLESCTRDLNINPIQITLLDVPSDRLGVEIHLVSMLSPENTAQVLELYSTKVLPFERIRQIHYLKEIPRSDLGKILWGELRRLI